MLYEKNIDFTPYVVDLCNGEQYSSWFLNLNPKGDVPVLQDGAFIIPNSPQIINYVESKFRGGDLFTTAYIGIINVNKEYFSLQRVIRR